VASMMMVRIPGPKSPAPAVGQLKPGEFFEGEALAADAKKPKRPKPTGPDVKVLLQDFAGDGAGASTWADSKGSAISFELKDAKKKSNADDKVLEVKYKHLEGGWCGVFAGANGEVDCSFAKALVVKVFSSKPLEFGISMEDLDKNKIDATLGFVNDYSGWTYMANLKLAGFERVGVHLPLALRLLQFDIGFGSKGYTSYDKGRYARPHKREIVYGISLNSAQLLDESLSESSRSGAIYTTTHKALEFYHVPVEKEYHHTL